MKKVFGLLICLALLLPYTVAGADQGLDCGDECVSFHISDSSVNIGEEIEIAYQVNDPELKILEVRWGRNQYGYYTVSGITLPSGVFKKTEWNGGTYYLEFHYERTDGQIYQTKAEVDVNGITADIKYVWPGEPYDIGVGDTLSVEYSVHSPIENISIETNWCIGTNGATGTTDGHQDQLSGTASIILGEEYEWVFFQVCVSDEQKTRTYCLVCGDTVPVRKSVPMIESEIVDSGYCGEKLTWALNDKGLLMIDGTGKMSDFVWDDTKAWCKYRDSIKNVVIREGATSIGAFAFSSCFYLESIEIPEGVTDIGEHAFFYCSLKSVSLPHSLVNIETMAFNCSELRSIWIPENVAFIGAGGLSNCRQLSEITVSESNPYYSSADGILYTKDGITPCQYPAGREDTCYRVPDGATQIKECVFDGCSKLTEIYLPDSVLSIENAAFYECSNLVSINIPSGLNSINDDFYGCGKLSVISIPAGNTYAIQWFRDHGFEKILSIVE